VKLPTGGDEALAS